LNRPASGRHTRDLDPQDARKLEDWKSSNPRGFAAWFKQRSVQSVDEKTSLQRVVSSVHVIAS